MTYLAMTTLSQLGFMVAALGIGGWVAGLFHLLTHAFFKALLFLGSGSVIHSVEHWMEEQYDHVSPATAQDIRNMGNMRSYMPLTWITYMIGYLALAGFPLFSGFWSKDEILADAFNAGFGDGSVLGIVVYVALSFAAFLTAFYMTRQIMVVFWGGFRGMHPRRLDIEHSEEVPVVSEAQGYNDHRAAVYEASHEVPRARHRHFPHESPLTMTLPLIVLALFALLGGFVNAGPLGIHWLSDFLGQEAAAFNYLTAGVATVLALAGIVLGVSMYSRAFVRSTDLDPLQRIMPGVFGWLENKFYIDELYRGTVGYLTNLFGRALSGLDRAVDGVVNGVGSLSLVVAKINFILDDFVLNQGADTLAEATTYTGDGLRQTTTGKIQDYGSLIFLGVLVIGLIYLYAFP